MGNIPDRRPVTIQSPTIPERLQKIGITTLKACLYPENGELAHEYCFVTPQVFIPSLAGKVFLPSVTISAVGTTTKEKT